MKTRPFHFKPENQRWPKLTAEKNRKNLSWNAARPNFTQFNSKGLEHRRLEVIGQYILSIRRIQPALKPWCRLLSQALVMRQIPEGQQRPAAQLASTEDDWVLMGSPKHGEIVAWHGMTFWKVEQLNDQLMAHFYQPPVARCRQVTWPWDSRCRRACDASNQSLRRWWPSPPGNWGLPPWADDIGGLFLCMFMSVAFFFRLHFGHIPSIMSIITEAAILFEYGDLSENVGSTPASYYIHWFITISPLKITLFWSFFGQVSQSNTFRRIHMTYHGVNIPSHVPWLSVNLIIPNSESFAGGQTWAAKLDN